MTKIPVLDDLGDVTGKRVLVRTDFNVPCLLYTSPSPRDS